MSATMNINKNTSLDATIMVDATPVVYLSASVSIAGGNDNTTQTIQNRELYQANKTDIRQQISAFYEEVYATQDAMTQE